MLWWLSLYHFSSDLIHELQTSASCCLLLFPHGYLKGISDLTCRKQNSRRRRWHPTQYYCLENPMDGGAWWAAVHGVTKSRTRLSDFTFTFHFHALEKEMATHSSILAWRIPGMGEPGRLPSMGLHRIRHDWSDLAAAATRKSEVYTMYLHTFCIFF